MANQNGHITVDEAKAKAKKSIDDYEGETIVALMKFIDGIDNIKNLRRAFASFDKMNTRITHPSTFDGEISPEYAPKLMAWKAKVRATLQNFNRETIPRLRGHVNQETNIVILRWAVAKINYLYEMTNSAEFAGVLSARAMDYSLDSNKNL